MANAKEVRTYQRLKTLLKKCESIFYPNGYACIECNKELNDDERELSLCKDCLEKLPYREDSVCPICATYVSTPGPCPRCRQVGMPFEKTYSLFDYVGIARNIINNYKDNARPWLHEYISKFLNPYALSLNLEVDLLVYVPSSPNAIKRRGYEHNELVAKSLACALKIPLIEPLARLRQKGDQTKLTYAERLRNVQKAFQLKDGFDSKIIKDKTILLYDDTMTTGATALSCASILKKAGAKNIIVITFART